MKSYVETLFVVLALYRMFIETCGTVEDSELAPSWVDTRSLGGNGQRSQATAEMLGRL